SEEHTSELQSHLKLVCRLLLEKTKSGAQELQPVRDKLQPRQHRVRPGAHERAPGLLREGPATLFFFTDPATTEIYTLSLHDALPISRRRARPRRTSPSTQTKSASCSSDRSRARSQEHTSELQSHLNLVCRLLLE